MNTSVLILIVPSLAMVSSVALAQFELEPSPHVPWNSSTGTTHSPNKAGKHEKAPSPSAPHVRQRAISNHSSRGGASSDGQHAIGKQRKTGEQRTAMPHAVSNNKRKRVVDVSPIGGASVGQANISRQLKTGEYRKVQPQAITDNKRKKVTTSILVAPSNQKHDSCPDGPDGSWCRALFK